MKEADGLVGQRKYTCSALAYVLSAARMGLLLLSSVRVAALIDWQTPGQAAKQRQKFHPLRSSNEKAQRLHAGT